MAFTYQATGQCNRIYVSNAYYNKRLNGYYYPSNLYSCNKRYIWSLDYYGPNHIQYIPDGGLNASAANGWIIGSTFCSTPTRVLARSQYGGDYKYPYNIPSGTWQEWDGGRFINNYQLSVVCSSVLSIGAIIGIVIGSLCGLFILIVIVAAVCTLVNKRKRQSAQAPVQEYPVVYTTGGPYIHHGQPATIILPPAYDNALPPAYVSNADYETVPCHGVTSSTTLTGHGAGPPGYANSGYTS